MKNDALVEPMIDLTYSAQVLRLLKTIEQKFTNEADARKAVIEWQFEELKTLRSALHEKNDIIAELNARLSACRTQSEGSRQLINKLVVDIDKLQQTIDWYKRTYESRSLMGVIKDKLKHVFR